MIETYSKFAIIVIIFLAVSAIFFSSDDETIIGQSLIVGIESTELSKAEKRILEKIKPGGVVLYSRNIDSVAQLKKLIASLQDISMQTSGLPLFIFIDEEPEGAYRLGIYRGVFNSGYPHWNAISAQTKFAKELCINVILAPVLDYPLVKNSFIKKRIPPIQSLEDFENFSQSFIRTLSDNGMLSTLKHFPGAGLLHDDTHNTISQFTGQALLDTSLSIFQKGINSGAAFVMTTHGIYTDIDPHNIATVSKAIIVDLLRKKMHFQGLIITDDISDMALVNKKNDLAQTSMLALKAGNNMIMFSHYLGKTERIFDEIKRSMDADPELLFQIKENYDKVGAYKFRYL